MTFGRQTTADYNGLAIRENTVVGFLSCSAVLKLDIDILRANYLICIHIVLLITVFACCSSVMPKFV